MIAALHGCGCGGECDHVHLGELGDDSIDLSTIDFGAPQPVFDPASLNLAPTSFPSLDTGTILEPTGSFFVGMDPLSYLENNPLPTTLPPSDLSVADASLMPVPAPAAPSGGGGTVNASTVATGALAAGSLATALAKLFQPSAPAGWTYNSAGQLVPTTAAAGSIPPGYTKNAAGQIVPISPGLSAWLSGSTVIAGVPNLAVLAGGIFIPVILLGSLKSGRRR